MGKTPKKAAPGGDERNLYKRRLKATTAPSNPSETSLHKRHSKLFSLLKYRRMFLLQSKVGVPVKVEVKSDAKQASNPPGSSKEKKLSVSEKGDESKCAEMQPESEEAEVKQNPSVQKEDISTEISKDTQESDKEHVDRASSEPVSISKVQEDTVNKEAVVVVEEEKTECQEKEKNSNETKEAEEQEEVDLNLSYETEDNVAKVQAERIEDKDSKEEIKEESSSTLAAAKNVVMEKEELQSESQTDTESYSADVLEFTTSEISETSESASQNDIPKKEEKVEEQSIGKDISFVSYDPSIMLKDVQIKLNDCLKENSKLFDTSSSGGGGGGGGSASGHSSLSQPSKDMSYGKTLRSICGRRSLSRMRHVTIREQRYSPNDSMFVNTSTASLAPDDSEDFKILRYNTGLSDTVSATNGSPMDGKRKHEIDDWNLTKKQKTESENSLLNSSIGLLKGLRRPIQVSTPISELKFQSGKLDLDEENKPANEDTKKWCVIM
ncbi:hypothetical protein WH47_11295 [Habropoda laboriosa]|uniref:Uncharacterized protein n=1 Tax=Habropoda laboriosa TaxID=597456 RepID=A0A0L7QKV0_9HYME|nr:hypothetical protein WH47_11295 [Habropoda laboriosa]